MIKKWNIVRKLQKYFKKNEYPNAAHNYISEDTFERVYIYEIYTGLNGGGRLVFTWHSCGWWWAVGKTIGQPRPLESDSWWNWAWGRAVSWNRWHIGPVWDPALWTRAPATNWSSCSFVPWIRPRRNPKHPTARTHTPLIRWCCWRAL